VSHHPAERVAGGDASAGVLVAEVVQPCTCGKGGKRGPCGIIRIGLGRKAKDCNARRPLVVDQEFVDSSKVVADGLLNSLERVLQLLLQCADIRQLCFAGEVGVIVVLE
jgi:hypothetical protein